ncbi:hypothetical protein SAMN06297251_11245 [Fulvimarina manganoxydans]|uniref:Uncharacterized protein n=1 Tax=Fulvimarina manganoxydans TaxID=937218 RepID=A0A1W2D0V5_9HYPH|nr:hypothetical protein [Fulvimarina manganoxydans]SMC91225.1 hypothetical protein SAMN06297251_11245 [Fulvimarina manganoxydans]
MMAQISMLAVDLSKGSFQVCAIGSDGTVLYKRAFASALLGAAGRPAGLRRGDGGVCDVASLGSRGTEERA